MRTRGMWIVAGLVMTAAPLLGQGGPRARGARGVGMGPMVPGVERNIGLALGRADELGLDENQVRELRAMQEELASVRGNLDQELQAYRQRIRDEERTLRETRRTEMEGMRQRRSEALGAFPDRYEGILSPAQQTQIREWFREDATRARRRVPVARDGRGPGVAPARGLRGGPGRTARPGAPVRSQRIRARAESGGRLLPAERAVLRSRVRAAARARGIGPV